MMYIIFYFHKFHYNVFVVQFSISLMHKFKTIDTRVTYDIVDL